MPGTLTLEIVEGPGAGRSLVLERALVVGRAPDADLVLDDGEVSRHHARLTPSPDGSVTVEDLDSTNGTFVNTHELHAPARLDPGDELLIGVTVLQLRSPQQVSAQPSAVRPVPPALATAPRPPAYVNPDVLRGEGGPGGDAGPARELDKYLDVRVRRRAELAPVALLALVAVALILYFGLK